jgi:hypothetical protein
MSLKLDSSNSILVSSKGAAIVLNIKGSANARINDWYQRFESKQFDNKSFIFPCLLAAKHKAVVL